MNTKNRGVSGDGTNESLVGKAGADFASLGSCLIGNNPEQTGRERKLRRRSLVLSTVLQAVVLLVVIAVPFFSKAERIEIRDGVIPIPPYHAAPNVVRERSVLQQTSGTRHNFCVTCPTVRPSPLKAGERIGQTSVVEGVENIPVGGSGTECSGCILIGNKTGPIPPPPDTQHIVRVTHISPAMLVDRIEPVYPTLAKQIHRDGHVELHAIISTDGTIEQLEVVSGDVIFYQSALDAVRRWRYRPTVLNGQAVEVDTYITVIYTLAR